MARLCSPLRLDSFMLSSSPASRSTLSTPSDSCRLNAFRPLDNDQGSPAYHRLTISVDLFRPTSLRKFITQLGSSPYSVSVSKRPPLITYTFRLREDEREHASSLLSEYFPNDWDAEVGATEGSETERSGVGARSEGAGDESDETQLDESLPRAVVSELDDRLSTDGDAVAGDKQSEPCITRDPLEPKRGEGSLQAKRREEETTSSGGWGETSKAERVMHTASPPGREKSRSPVKIGAERISIALSPWRSPSAPRHSLRS
jgi:hypothetical protein